MDDKKYSKEFAKKEIISFYEALEIGLEDLEKEIEISNEDSKSITTTPLKEAIGVLGIAIEKGRLVLDAENITATYTLKTPIVTGDFDISKIELNTKNCTAKQVKVAKAEFKNKKEWAFIELFNSEGLTKNVLDNMSNSDANIMQYLAQLFLAY